LICFYKNSKLNTHFDRIRFQNLLVILVKYEWLENEDNMGEEGHMGIALFGGSYGEWVWGSGGYRENGGLYWERANFITFPF